MTRRLTVAAARVCDPWYRVQLMACKLQRELGRLEPPPNAEGPFVTLVCAVETVVAHAGALVDAAERAATDP